MSEPKSESFRRRNRRSARSALLSGVLTIAVLHVGLLIAYRCDYWVSDPVYAHRSSLLHRSDNDHPVTVIAFGTSRVGHGFDGLRLDAIVGDEFHRPSRAFNFGFPGIGPMTENVYLRRLLEEGIHPDLVVIETYVRSLADFDGLPFDKSGLSPERISGSELRRVSRYGYPREDVIRKRLQIAVNPWGELRLPIMSHIWPQSFAPDNLWFQLSKTDDRGWQGRSGKDESEQSRQKATAAALHEQEPILKNWKQSRNEINALRDLITFCRSKKIDVMLVSMPESPAFRSHYAPETKAELERIVGGMSSELGVKWIRASDWFDDSHFHDGHHLTAEGAAEFTDRLGRDYILPALRARNLSASQAATRSGF